MAHILPDQNEKSYTSDQDIVLPDNSARKSKRVQGKKIKGLNKALKQTEAQALTLDILAKNLVDNNTEQLIIDLEMLNRLFCHNVDFADLLNDVVPAVKLIIKSNNKVKNVDYSFMKIMNQKIKAMSYTLSKKSIIDESFKPKVQDATPQIIDRGNDVSILEGNQLG
jgi:hypothetical protein